MDPSIVDTVITSRKRKREKYKKIMSSVAACVVHMEPTRNWELEHHNFLNQNGGLVRTRNVPTTEAVAMFLHILAHNLKYRVMQFSYCRSKETISRQFNDVLRVVMKVSKDYLNFQPCTLEGAEANKWRWFEVNVLEHLTGLIFRFQFLLMRDLDIDCITKPFRFKVLQNWDDIVDLCAKDRVTGHGVETAMDAEMSRETNEVEFMGLCDTATINLEEPSSNTKEKRQGSTSSGTHSHKRKMREKVGITTSLDKMVDSFNRMVEKMDGKVDDEDIQEVLLEAALIPNLNRQQWAKTIKWLVDDPKQLAIVKALPIHEKTDYVLTHLAE
ncbi:hypothetical protein HKD37_18G050812 [Glycine soja]